MIETLFSIDGADIHPIVHPYNTNRYQKGMGLSSVAIHVARYVQSRDVYKDGVVFVSLGGVRSFDQAIRLIHSELLLGTFRFRFGFLAKTMCMYRQLT